MAQKEVEDSRQQLMDQSGQKRDLSVVPQRPVDIKNDIARAASALDKMDMPALGHRFKEELGRTRELLDKASKGDPDALDNAKDNVDRLSALFKAESGMLQNVPAGLPKRLTLDRILDAIESTLEDAARAKPVLAAASIYASNAKLYNSERDERDSLLDFIVEKGTGDAKQDETALRSFRSNALVMQEDGKKRAASWHGEISRQLALVKSPAVRQALKALDQGSQAGRGCGGIRAALPLHHGDAASAHEGHETGIHARLRVRSVQIPRRPRMVRDEGARSAGFRGIRAWHPWRFQWACSAAPKGAWPRRRRYAMQSPTVRIYPARS